MKRIIVLSTLLTILIYSCKKEVAEKAHPIETLNQKEVEVKNDTNTIKEKQESLITLYSIMNDDNTEELRISANKPSEYSNFFLVADTNFIIISKYLKNNEKFLLSRKDTLLTNHYTYTDIDSSSFNKKRIGSKEYLCLSVKETFKGTAVTEKNATFFMIDTENLKIYTLVYTGISSLRSCDECIDGKFYPNKELDKQLEIKKSLYELAGKSKFIYHPSKKELDISFYKNYEKKWYIDNKSDNNLANGYSPINEVIYSTYYKENIFDYTGDIENQDTIENEYYKIVNFFRNNILGFDKHKKLYFPIHVESCATGCNKTINFISDNEIKVIHNEGADNDYSKIKLDKIKFSN